MTNSYTDMKNAKRVLVQGSNFVENHPGCVQFVNEAIESDNECKVLVVDCRKTRTANWAVQRGGKFYRSRPGTDIAITMGLINYAIDRDHVDWEYAYTRTDAPFYFNPTASGSPSDGAFGGNNNQCDYERDKGYLEYDGRPRSNTADTSDIAGWKNACEGVGSGDSPYTVFSYLKDRASHYTPDVVSAITGLTATEFEELAEEYTAPGNRPGSIYYAMGGTQHSYGSQQLHCYCMLQLLLGNMGRVGGGVNALRGIHNVQGSTDMGLLKGLIPGYSAPPATGDTYVGYMDGLFGSASGAGLQQLGFRNMLNAFYNQAATPAAAATGTYDRNAASACPNLNFPFMPKGDSNDHITMFQNMKWRSATGGGHAPIKALYCFGQNPAVTEPNLDEVKQGLHDLDTLIVQDMYMSETATCSRRPATGGAAAGKTILLPSCAHVEEAGSVTNSARLIQWRYMAKPPNGMNRNDLWILLRLAEALSAKGAFDHIDLQPGGSFTDRYAQLYGSQYHDVLGAASAVSWSDWAATGSPHPNGFRKYNGELVAENVYKQMCGDMGLAPWGTVWIYAGAFDQKAASGTSTARYGVTLESGVAAGAPTLTVNKSVSATGADAIFNITAPCSAYLGNLGVNASGESFGNNSKEGVNGAGNAEIVLISAATGNTITLSASGRPAKAHAAGEPLTVKGYWSHDASDGMLAKSKAFYDPFDTGLFPRFAFAWLVNRRVFYNNTPCPGGRPTGKYVPEYVTYCETCANLSICTAPGDAADGFVAPDKRGRLFVHHSSDKTPVMDTQVYRKYNALGDMDYPPAFPATGSGGWTETSSLGYGYNRTRFPKHWEPWESPSETLSADYGRTGRGPTEGGTGWNYASAAATGSPLLGDVGNYPYVLTTYRVCWHFQGGPMTRNVPWLAELDPDAVIEINSTDAYYKGIATGDEVIVKTKRATSQYYKARVGVGTSADQNIMQGVVGIPWHWGRAIGRPAEAALTEGPSANEACIDAADANCWIPESKACLCNIQRKPS